ncbi:hypothetical protein ACH5RR_038762 [Cinchona calisaya]|uniref:KIB1-4 beta-propeller domain-containing protein n=1 Tax=Cinchona calisaya TaxID=153742 RepID=A0ABD2Y1U0_9GENT
MLMWFSIMVDPMRFIIRDMLWCRKELYMVESLLQEKQQPSLLLLTRDNLPNWEDNQGIELEYPVYGTIKFKVSDLDLSVKGKVKETPWKEIKNLGSRALFLGDSASILLEVLDNKLAPMIKPNHICFTDDSWEGYMAIP